MYRAHGQNRNNLCTELPDREETIFVQRPRTERRQYLYRAPGQYADNICTEITDRTRTILVQRSWTEHRHSCTEITDRTQTIFVLNSRTEHRQSFLQSSRTEHRQSLYRAHGQNKYNGISFSLLFILKLHLLVACGKLNRLIFKEAVFLPDRLLSALKGSLTPAPPPLLAHVLCLW